MELEKKDRRTLRDTPHLDSSEFGKIKGARHLVDNVCVPVRPGTVDENIYYGVCEGYAHPRWKTPLRGQTFTLTGTFETRIEAQKAMLRSHWLEKKEPGKVRCVFVMRSCNGMRTWQQFMTTVSQ